MNGTADLADRLIKEMTLEEKVGEMTQVTLQVVSGVAGSPGVPHRLDQALLEDAILGHHVGSLLNVWDMAYDVDHWHRVVDAVQTTATRRRLPIPVLYGVDAVHGHNYLLGGTVFPHNLAMAATWNEELVREANRITALEVRATGVPWNFSPVLDIGRQPLWSRFCETFGEDVYLATKLGQAAIHGLQGEGPGNRNRVAATAKHFVGYSTPISGKDRTPSWLTERELREYYLPPFEAAFGSGVATVMINSGEIDGVPVHANPELLTTMLRDELAFTGVAVSDWEDVVKLHSHHRVADTPKEAVRLAVLAGIDMSMTPFDFSFYDHLLELVREGSISETRIDLSVRRILTLKQQLGLFDHAGPSLELVSEIGSEQSAAVSRRAAREAITLLENREGLLPLEPGVRILVAGPGADAVPPLFGSWSYTWQGDNADAYPQGIETVFRSISNEFSGSTVRLAEGTTYETVSDLGAIVAEASQADVAVLVLAEEPSAEKPGDIDDLGVADAQLELVRAVAESGTRVVLVLLFNRPRIVRQAAALADAVLLAYNSGPYTGLAVAEVLSGATNPQGRLPFTYPRYSGSVLHYDHKQSERLDPKLKWGGFDPQWEFGHGLSYSTFEYSNLEIDRRSCGPDDTLGIRVSVKNTGDRSGNEVVQVYVQDLYASIAPPVKRLRRFAKIALDADEERTIDFTISVCELAFVDADNKWTVEAGQFEVQIAGLAASFTVTH